MIGRLVDELEHLGYVRRRPDPDDRRGRLVVPTDRGVAVMRLSDAIVADIERSQARELGRGEYERFLMTLQAVVGSLSARSDRESGDR